MRECMALPLSSPAIDPAFQNWKYWKAHPFHSGSRGHIIQNESRMISHGCRWPIRFNTDWGDFEAFHLVDWAADRTCAGAGMSVLRACSEGFSAVFSIGGSAASQKMISAFGFRPRNQIWFLRRPLLFSRSAGDNSALDWKTPARFLRDSFRCVYPHVNLGPGWSYKPIAPAEIPSNLFPRHASTEAASKRDANLLSHIEACPLFEKVGIYAVACGAEPIAYFMLALARSEVRLIDFGPSDLDARQATMVGVSAQLAARSDFPAASMIVTATTTPSVQQGFISSGFRSYSEKPIRFLALSPTIRTIESFRLTLIDWDACCL